MENAAGHPAQSEDFYPNVKVVYDGPDLRCFEVTNAPHKMENAAGHPAQPEDFYPNVKVVYFPPNTTDLL